MHAPRSALVGAACLEVCVVLVMDDNRPADSESPIESNSTSFADCLSLPPNNGIAASVTCSLARWPVSGRANRDEVVICGSGEVHARE